MCIIFQPSVFKASKTLLILAPLATPPSLPQAWQLVYINSIDRAAAPAPAQTPLMIVPLPNPHRLAEHDFTLFPVSDACATSVRAATSDLLAAYAPPLADPSAVPGGAFGAAHSLFGAPAPPPPLRVQPVGGYNISVAPSLHDLETRAPWAKFSVHPDQLRAILSDVRARYASRPMAFVVAEGTPNDSPGPYLSQAGFAVMYRDASSNGGFFPTSHEPSFDDPATAPMDVTLVALGAVLRPLSILSHAQHAGIKRAARPTPFGFGAPHAPQGDLSGNVVLRADDSFTSCPPKWPHVARLLSELPRRGTGKWHADTIVQPEWPRLVTVWELAGTYANTDVLARKATASDVAAVERMYIDLDSWMRARARVWPAQTFAVAGHTQPPTREQLSRVDFVLTLLARQLADPGINDRLSDAICPHSGKRRDCGGVAYVNLDKDNVDLDEMAYRNKETWARVVKTEGKSLDTVGTTYIRVSAMLSAMESLEMRTVHGSEQKKEEPDEAPKPESLFVG